MASDQVRSASLTGYADLARSLGLDPGAQLRAAGIDLACLDNPDIRIPVVRFNALLEASAEATGVEDFGLRLAMSRRLTNLGLIALAAREEPTVGAALACLQRTIHLHVDGIRIEIDQHGGIVAIRAMVLSQVPGSIRQSMELTVGVLYRVTKELLGAGWSPLAVCFTHPAPRKIASYRRQFQAAVQFNSVLNGLTCRAADLERAMPSADPQSLRIIQQYLQAADSTPATEQERTTRLILNLLPSGRCTADLVARYFGVDRRTLHRRLAAEGTNFSALLGAVRETAAQRHLIDSAQSVAELAAMLGFSDTSAFSRWFSERFGCSPRQWRSQQRAGPSAA